MNQRNIFFLFLMVFAAIDCKAQETNYELVKGQFVLTAAGASQFAKLPLRCAE